VLPNATTTYPRLASCSLTAVVSVRDAHSPWWKKTTLCRPGRAGAPRRLLAVAVNAPAGTSRCIACMAAASPGGT
jgi:hypothetical protein